MKNGMLSLFPCWLIEELAHSFDITNYPSKKLYIYNICMLCERNKALKIINQVSNYSWLESKAEIEKKIGEWIVSL